MKEKILKAGAMAMMLLFLVGEVWAVESWAPNTFYNPARIYDDGTYVEYKQWFKWDSSHIDELHDRTSGYFGQYMHEFRRNVDKWDFEDSRCNDYGWWTNLPNVHEASEEAEYPWCDVAFQNDEEAELVSESPQDIVANKWYFVDMMFKKRVTTGTLTLKTEAEYSNHWSGIPQGSSELTSTTEPA